MTTQTKFLVNVDVKKIVTVKPIHVKQKIEMSKKFNLSGKLTEVQVSALYRVIRMFLQRDDKLKEVARSFGLEYAEESILELLKNDCIELMLNEETKQFELNLTNLGKTVLKLLEGNSNE